MKIFQALKVFFSVLAALTVCAVPLKLSAQDAYEVGPNTPVYFSDSINPLVFEDKEGTLTFSQVRDLGLSRFVEFESIKKINPISYYWVVQRLKNRIGENREFIVNAGWIGSRLNWIYAQHFVVFDDGTFKELNGSLSGNIQVNLQDVDPYTFYMDTALSKTPVFNLKKDSEVQIFSRLKSNSSLPATSFVINFYDRATYSELRRYGLYIEGILAGFLLSMIIWVWNNLIYKRDFNSLTYGIWLIFGFLQIMSMPVHDGQRLFEFFIPIEPSFIGVLPAGAFWVSLIAYSQILLYVLFARSFLGTHHHFKRLHIFINFFFFVQVTYFFLTCFVEHEFSDVFFSPLMLLQTFVLLALFVVSIKRYRQGFSAAKYMSVALVLYFFFWGIFFSQVSGLVSLNNLLPSTGLSLFIKESYVIQALAISFDAVIFSFAVASRSRHIEKKLSITSLEQKQNVENQNKILEKTVADRTLELSKQHEALSKTHGLMLSSVNYASRLQRGQLPRPLRIDGRFDSFAALWEPRDTIGGDLYWLSSSLHEGPFVLAVADCTGHGVPGAMLSLLVSNSLERIYSTSINKVSESNRFALDQFFSMPQRNYDLQDPAVALLSLDHYVRTGLNQDRTDSESDDGCDAAIMLIDSANQMIEFAAAKLSLFQVSAEGKLTRHHGAKCSLGYQSVIADSDKPLIKKIHYLKGDTFVVVTDGITDQIGGLGANKLSYGYRRLEELIKTNCTSSADNIVSALKSDLASWQGDNQRRDDVTAVVFRL